MNIVLRRLSETTRRRLTDWSFRVIRLLKYQERQIIPGKIKGPRMH